VALIKELGVSRRQLYRWRDELDPGEPEVGKPPGQKSRLSTLRKEVNHLKRVLVEKTLEVDFFRSALQKSRLDASRAASLARRHLRSNPGSDAVVRWLEHRAHVSTGSGEPGRLLPVVARTAAVGGRAEDFVVDEAGYVVAASESFEFPGCVLEDSGDQEGRSCRCRGIP